MANTKKLNILCVSRFFKGSDFLTSVHDEGHQVYLLTSTKLKNDPWPFNIITEAFYMDEDSKGEWNMEHAIEGLAHTIRRLKFDAFIALDDFDVENVAYLREHFRMPGMGETTARYFRDKLAMRMKAQEEGISVPAFTALFHDEDIEHYANTVPAPWLIKPRSQASATGIKKIHDKAQLWEVLNSLGGERHHYLLEKFAPGAVFHVDSLIFDGKVLFAKASQYVDTPFEVAHGGGIFRSATIGDTTADAKALLKMNNDIMKAFGMVYSASHTEFIKCHEDGKYYFLETSARVGGAHLAEMVEYATGINLWKEWAKIEIASKLGKKYTAPKPEKYHAGILVSLSRYQKPDLAPFNHKNVCWKMDKDYHVGFILRDTEIKQVHQLLNDYTEIVKSEYHASLPAPDRPTN